MHNFPDHKLSHEMMQQGGKYAHLAHLSARKHNMACNKDVLLQYPQVPLVRCIDDQDNLVPMVRPVAKRKLVHAYSPIKGPTINNHVAFVNQATVEVESEDKKLYNDSTFLLQVSAMMW